LLERSIVRYHPRDAREISAGQESDLSLYLRPDVVIEPLVDSWHATPFLLSPLTAALLVANKHVPILKSFLGAPATHWAASRNPAMVGGPFVAYDESRVGDVKELLRRTMDARKAWLDTAAAVAQLDALLGGLAGESLAPLYPKVPRALQGCVELVYDVHNRATARFIEPALDKRLESSSAQAVALFRLDADERPFTMSTPKLPEKEHLRVERAFGDEGVSALFEMRDKPRSMAEMVSLLSLDADQQATLSSLVSDVPPRRATAEDAGSPRIRYFGHACLSISFGTANLLFDPFIGYETAGGTPRYSHSALPDTLDYVFITHAHLDHCVPETLLQLRHKATHVVVPRSGGGRRNDPSLKRILQRAGFRRVHEIDECETIEVGRDARVTSIPFLGEHGDLDVLSKTAYLFDAGGRKALISADSNVLETRLYDYVRELHGTIDALFIGMECRGAPMSWTYGPLLPTRPTRQHDETRRLNGANCSAVLEIVDRLKPKAVYVYAMGMEPWLSHVMGIGYSETSPQILESTKLVRECQSRGLVAERLFGQKDIVLA
jgi:L-ascorbate metabolism protein UlaG (beta-lactamase superfamily)